jgi:uncharacterized membrane protein
MRHEGRRVKGLARGTGISFAIGRTEVPMESNARSGSGPTELPRQWPRPDTRNSSKINVGNTERVISVALGAGIAWYALARMRRGRTGALALGGSLLHRGLTGYCMLNHLVGRDSAATDSRVALSGSGGIKVLETVTIDRPASALYRAWRKLENLPRFMRHLESVTALDGRRSHWVARGPAGVRFEWDARIVNEVEDKVIGWQSVGEADVVSAGSVSFREREGGVTEVAVNLQYAPPAGRVGATLASWLGEDPATQIREDLRAFKRLMESGGLVDPAELSPGEFSAQGRAL